MGQTKSYKTIPSEAHSRMLKVNFVAFLLSGFFPWTNILDVVPGVGGGGGLTLFSTKKNPKTHTLFRTTTSILLPCLGHAIPCL